MESWLGLKRTWEVFPCPCVDDLRDLVLSPEASTDEIGGKTVWRPPFDSVAVVVAAAAEPSVQLRQQKLRHSLRLLGEEILTYSSGPQRMMLKLMLLRQSNLSSGRVMNLESERRQRKEWMHYRSG